MTRQAETLSLKRLETHTLVGSSWIIHRLDSRLFALSSLNHRVRHAFDRHQTTRVDEFKGPGSEGSRMRWMLALFEEGFALTRPSGTMQPLWNRALLQQRLSEGSVGLA